MTNNKIVLLTSGQPSLNPRLVKEADALCDAGYQVTVIYQYWNEWGTRMDVDLLRHRKWNAIKVGGDPNHHKLTFLKVRTLQKLAKMLIKLSGFKWYLAELALNRSIFALYHTAVKDKASMYIAHNLGALPAAIWAAKQNGSKCGFDAEDFHRNEVSSNPSSPDVILKTYLENKYMPQVTYLTTASPLISEAYRQLYPNQNPKTILNVFPKQYHQTKFQAKKGKTLKLFWFSQTVGKNRGLEDVIVSMGKVGIPIELHLLGNYDIPIQQYFTTLAARAGLNQEMIFFYPPMPPQEIFSFAAQFDIGLATEIREPKNRDICLTNKIFTYIQSGLAVIASDTLAQQDLMEKYPNMGFIYNQANLDTLSDRLNLYATDAAMLTLHQKTAARYAEEDLNWEKEKGIFLSLVEKHLN